MPVETRDVFPVLFEIHAQTIPYAVTIKQPEKRIPRTVSTGFNVAMKTTDEIRRENLRHVVDRDFGGKAGRLADAVKRPRPNISQVLSGVRSFGETLARDIERILGLPRNYLDDMGDSMTPADVAAAFESGSEGKREALTLLAKLPDGEAETILPLIRSILSKYE